LRLKSKGYQPLRTIHLLYVPDEETGGIYGMKLLLKDPIFPTLRVGIALDEGECFSSVDLRCTLREKPDAGKKIVIP
jgi:aminoacylase